MVGEGVVLGRFGVLGWLVFVVLVVWVVVVFFF